MTVRARLPARLDADFHDRAIVDCPACGGLAVVAASAGGRRMTCTACAKVLEGAAHDVTLDQVLRLRIETRAGALYAYNADHLDYLESFIAADLREEIVSADGPRNRSILSRLPAWAKSGKNRDEVLKAIARARAKLI